MGRLFPLVPVCCGTQHTHDENALLLLNALTSPMAAIDAAAAGAHSKPVLRSPAHEEESPTHCLGGTGGGAGFAMPGSAGHPCGQCGAIVARQGKALPVCGSPLRRGATRPSNSQHSNSSKSVT